MVDKMGEMIDKTREIRLYKELEAVRNNQDINTQEKALYEKLDGIREKLDDGQLKGYEAIETIVEIRKELAPIRTYHLGAFAVHRALELLIDVGYSDARYITAVQGIKMSDIEPMLATIEKNIPNKFIGTIWCRLSYLKVLEKLSAKDLYEMSGRSQELCEFLQSCTESPESNIYPFHLQRPAKKLLKKIEQQKLSASQNYSDFRKICKQMVASKGKMVVVKKLD